MKVLPQKPGKKRKLKNSKILVWICLMKDTTKKHCQKKKMRSGADVQSTKRFSRTERTCFTTQRAGDPLSI